MGALLCYFLCLSLSVSPLWSAFCPIPDIYANISVFNPYSPLMSATVCFPSYSTQMRGEGGGWGGVAWVTKN